MNTENEDKELAEMLKTATEILNGVSAIAKGAITGISMIDKSVKAYEKVKRTDKHD